jgi:hypothetical protein
MSTGWTKKMSGEEKPGNCILGKKQGDWRREYLGDGRLALNRSKQ